LQRVKHRIFQTALACGFAHTLLNRAHQLFIFRRKHAYPYLSLPLILVLIFGGILCLQNLALDVLEFINQLALPNFPNRTTLLTLNLWFGRCSKIELVLEYALGAEVVLCHDFASRGSYVLLQLDLSGCTLVLFFHLFWFDLV
jgi:hypothetical protein